jgi:chromosome segregation ATPase
MSDVSHPIMNPVPAQVNISASETQTTPDPTPAASTFDQQGYQAVQALIERLCSQLDEVKEKQKETRQSLTNVFANDQQLSEFENQAKNASKAFKQRKTELQQTPEAKQLSAKLKEMSEEVKDIEDSLTNHLISYFQMTGTKSFSTLTGEEREFKVLAKLLPKK